jgi:hypothetical protein
MTLNVTEPHAFCSSADVDWVSFAAQAGTRYRIETLNLAPSVDTYLELYERDGVTVLAADDDGNGNVASLINQTITTAGVYYIKILSNPSTNGASNLTYDLRMSADVEAPDAPANLRSLGRSTNSAFLTWEPSSDHLGVVSYDIFAGSKLVSSTSHTQTLIDGLAAGTTFTFTVAAKDAAGNSSAPSNAVSITTKSADSMPPDPVLSAPPSDSTIASDLARDTAFLYTGADPIQSGVAPDTIQPQRVAILRGRVITRDGEPLAGVQISILGHDEYGRTASRADGAFDLAVNGGGRLSVDYQKDGYLPAQRQVLTSWRDYVTLPDVALVALDQAVTTISLDEISQIQTVVGSVVSDTDGVRQAVLLFPAHTTATLELPNGTALPLTTLHVRATEYTVGEHGPAAMPGTLPVESGYTYAVEYSVDEALVVGARQVRFSRPVIAYVENFLDFPVGGLVPVGTYDRERATWVASDSGRIITIVDIVDGRADLDIDGDGHGDDSGALAIGDAEREQLASRYAIGQELWRVSIPHFSAWDFN